MRRTIAVALGIAAALTSATASAEWVPLTFGQIGIPFGPPVPTATPPSAASLATTQNLDAAKTQDSGRRLEWVWIDTSGGFEQLGMATFSGGNTFVAGLVKTSSSGGAVSAGIGARLLYLTFLLRGRIGVFDSGQLYRIGPELGFHVPLGNVEPHAEVGLGYGAVGNLKDTVGGAAASFLALRGGYGRVGAGLDYFVAPVFSIGASLSAEMLGLTRPALTMAEYTVLSSKVAGGASPSLLSAGTGIGGTIALTAVAALHF